MGLVGQALVAGVASLLVAGSSAVAASPSSPERPGCDDQAVAVGYRTSGTEVTAVRLTGLARGCAGRTAVVRLRDCSGRTLATTAPATVTGGPLVLPVPGVPAERVSRVSVVIRG